MPWPSQTATVPSSAERRGTGEALAVFGMRFLDVADRCALPGPATRATIAVSDETAARRSAMSLAGSPNGTRVEEPLDDTEPLPVRDPFDGAGVRPLGSPTDPFGDRHPDDRPPAAPSPRPGRPVPRTVWFFVIVAVLGVAAALSANLVMG